MNTKVRGNSLYTFVDGPSWLEAEAEANRIGGNLVTINSSEENDFIKNILNSYFEGLDSFRENNQVYFIRNGQEQSSDVWIGLNDAESEQNFKWSSGQDVTYIETNELFDSGNQDYVGLRFVTAERWGWADFTNSDQDFSPGQGADIRYSQKVGLAEIPLKLSITTSDTPTEGSGIFTTSINLSAGSQTSGNLAEGVQVFWKVGGISEEDLASGSLSGSGKIVNGKLDIQQSLISDADSGENFELSIFSDVELTQQVGNTFSVAIAEESGPITIRAKRSTTLNPGDDNLILTGTFSINGKGNSRDNLIVGNNAKNFLDGKKGKDKLKGKRGEDILIGDRGGDILTGGRDSDVFKYRSIKDSGVKGKSRDVITDFQPFIDQIDLSKIDAFKGQRGNQEFVYIGSNEFTGTQGEVRFESGFLSLNTDSDTVADSTIKLTGITAFSGDFLIL